MDDEIDIEEHDILEHPQVKAVFPDLSKIQIEVHTSGGTFLDESLEESGNTEDRTEESETASENKDGNYEEVLEEEENEDLVLSDYSSNTEALNHNLEQIASPKLDNGVENEFDDHIVDELQTGNDREFEDTNGITDENEWSEPTPDIENIEENEQNNAHTQNSDLTSDIDDTNQGYDKFVRIKEEIVFESDNSSEYEEILPDYREENYDGMFHLNNKIILGSKPNRDIQTPSKCLVVLLEDWAVHLNQNPCYCSDCKTLFATPSALDFHRMSAHSLLAPIQNRAIKSTAKSSIVKNVSKKSTANKISNSTYCNHCNVSFKDHTSLIKHLYELLPVSKYNCNVCDATFKGQNDLINHNTTHVKVEARNVLKPKKTTDKENKNAMLKKMLNTEMKPMTSKALKRPHSTDDKASKKKRVDVKKEVDYKWMCRICKMVFDSYGRAKYHRKVQHKHISAYTLLLKKIPNKTPSNSKIKFEKEKGNKKFELIQSTALFQCTKCGLHFLSCVAGKSHFTARQCGVHNNTWSCTICKKNIRKHDSSYHKKQHELSNKIKIYKITKNTYERTLCRCLRCNVYFEYIALRLHIDQCGKIDAVKCKECSISIPKNKYLEHTQKHDVMKLKRKDFILIDYTVINEKKTKAVKAKVNNPAHTNLLGKQIAIKTEKGTSIINKLKFEKEKRNIFYCEHCKSFFNRTYTSINHKTKKCMTRVTNTSICETCGLRVNNKIMFNHEKLHKMEKLHLNDFKFIDYITRKPIIPPIPQYPACEKCHIHFLSNAAKKNHICGEDYENCEICGDQFEVNALKTHLLYHQLRIQKPSPILPELMMKYESLNAIWNILFLCGKCDLITDMYDAAVEHSQAHLAKNAQTNTIKCYICNLKFDENCWKKHSELHSRMPLNSKSFRILNYSPKELLDESWFKMFASLPEKETRQILDRSVFGAERSLKMVLTKNGLPEFTVYCCSECSVCCDNASILEHVNSDCIKCEDVCVECDMTFDSAESLMKHEELHAKGIKKDEFRIVSFIKSMTVSVKKKVKAKEAKYTVYKCVVCTVSIIREYSRATHSCSPKHHIIFCKKCKLNISFRQKAGHEARHRKMTDFVAKNIRIEELIPEGKERKRNKKSSKKGAKLNPKRIPENSKVPETCETTEERSLSAESFESFVNVLTDSKPRKSNRISDEERTSKIYKCDCGLHYTSLRGAQKHTDSCDGNNDISKENCSKCGLLFPTDLLVAHLCRDHSRATHLSVEVVQRTEIKHSAVDTIKLYKCGECNVYFLNQNSCYKHINRHEPLDSMQYIECKICRLQFRILSLHIHMKKHHRNEFRLDKVLVEEYKPRVGSEAPKIDIYFANERFENVQVSSSND